MGSPRIVYGVCVGSWGRFNDNVVTAETEQLIALSGQTSIARAYREIQRVALGLSADILILQHDDLEITDPDAEAKIIEAIKGGADLVGVAGGGSDGGIAWWNQNPIGHQRTDVGEIDFGVRAGDVQALEGSLIAMSRWAIESGVMFDNRYPGFHGYDADICRQVFTNTFLEPRDRRVTVVDIDTHHHTQMGFKSAQSHEDWLTADRIFRDKWRLA